MSSARGFLASRACSQPWANAVYTASAHASAPSSSHSCMHALPMAHVSWAPETKSIAAAFITFALAVRVCWGRYLARSRKIREASAEPVRVRPDLVMVKDAEFGRGLFASQEVMKGEVLICDAPDVRIREHDIVMMHARLLEQRLSSSRYACICRLLDIQDGFRVLDELADGSTRYFDPYILEEMEIGAIQASLGRGPSVLERFRAGLLTFQSNAWQGSGYLGLYSRVCLVNHSCSPNVEVSCADSFVKVEALRPIDCGEELLVNYCKKSLLLWPVTKRQSALKATLGFMCGCGRCRTELQVAASAGA